MTLESTVRLLENFLSGSRDSIVMEAGAAVFDRATANYSIFAELGKCFLQIWSAERNIVRPVLEGEIRNGVLGLAMQRLGQTRPLKLAKSALVNCELPYSFHAPSNLRKVTNCPR